MSHSRLMNAARLIRIAGLVLFARAFFMAEPCCGASTAAAALSRLSRTNLLLFRQSDGSIVTVKTPDDWQQRRRTILRGMEEVMGPLPGNEKRCALEPLISEEVDCGTYVRRFLTYASEPGSRVPAYLLIPKHVLMTTNRAPAVLALHQTHSSGQKVVVGLGNSPNDSYGVELAERGFVVFAPPYTMLANYWPNLKTLGYRSGTMKSIWDNIRGLDLLLTMSFVKTNGVAVIGHSLGGHNGVFTAVFDDRIKAVVSSCGLDSFVDYKNGDITGWTQDRYMPKLKDYARQLDQVPFDFPEMIAALAPRVCFISAPMGDSNFRWRSVAGIVEAARPIFSLHGVSQNLQVAHPDCGHLFPIEMRERAYKLIEEALSTP